MSWKIGAVQPTDIQGDIPTALATISDFASRADREQVDVVCFPECFLQGYTLDEDKTRARALNLASPKFSDILLELSRHKVAIVLGLIEEDEGAYFNTAVIFKEGKLIGKYRKVNLFEKNFRPGKEFPLFRVSSLAFGINICYDARFSAGAQALAVQGARVILYPLNNRLTVEKANKCRDKHVPNLVARAKETGCWIVSADVVWKDAETIGYGCTAIVDPEGKLITQAPELNDGMVSVLIPE